MNDTEKNFRKKRVSSHANGQLSQKKISMLYGIILHVLCIMTDKNSCAIWETNRCIHV